MSGLALGFYAFPFFVAVAVGLVIPLLMAAAYRSLRVGVLIFGIAFCMTAAFPAITQGGLQLGVRLDLLDMAALILMGVTFLRMLLAKGSLKAGWAFYLFAAVVCLNLVQGLIVFKTAAGVAARPEIYSLTAMAYVVTFAADELNMKRLVQSLLFMTFWLVMLTAYRWIAVGFDIRELLPPSGSFQPRGSSIWRVIVSSEALLLAEIAVLAWLYSRPGQLLQGWQWTAPALLVMVVVLQHRSTWLSLIAAVAMALVAARVAGRGAGRSWGLFAVLGVMVLTLSLVAGRSEGLGGDMARSAGDAVALRGTAGERLDSWQQLVREWASGGPRRLLLGTALGTSNERYNSEDLGARKISYQAHNYYVTVLTTQGAIGFGAYLAMYLTAFVGLFRALRDPALQERASILISLLGAQVVYYLTYGTHFVQALVLGMSLAFVGQRGAKALLHAKATAVRPFQARPLSR